MHRFFCRTQNISGDKIIIDDKEQAHHIKDVLRLKEKEKVVVADGRGYEYNCLIAKLTDKIILDIQSKHSSKETGIGITLACAIPKKAKIDDIIDKLTQLGVDRIIPIETGRTVIRLDKQKKAERLQRWKKIALAASQQSQRSCLPIIDPVKDIKEVLSEAEDYDLKLIPTLEGARKSLKGILSQRHYRNILVFIGPEGDFTDGEVALAKKSGCIPVSLGKQVLRVDTAAIAVASFIKLYADS